MSGRAGSGRAALALIGLSLALVLATGALGPSAATVPLPQRRRGLPPYWFDVHPSPWLVSGLLLTALATGAAGLLAGLHALRTGWRPSPRYLVGAGAAAAFALVLVPPMGSADVLVYAAYGRLAALGDDPYTQTAADLAARGDPIGRAVEAPWTDVPSAYGPVATAEHRLAAQLGAAFGGPSTHATVFWIALLGALAYVLTGWLLQRLVGALPTARARVGLLWSLNPLLLYEVVGGAHVDGLAVMFAVVALVALRRRPLLAGLLVGAACAVKLTYGLYAVALVWAMRRHRGGLAALLAGGLLVAALAYLPVGLHALDQVRAVSRLVSFAVPWRLLVGPLEAVVAQDTARTVISVAALVAFVAFAVVVARLLPPASADHAEGVTGTAVRAAAVLTVAWLLTAPYSLPWYDAIAWAPLAALPGSRLDALLVARTAVMGAAYVPGRVVPLPRGLDTLALRALRGVTAPAVGIVLIVAAVVSAVTSAGRPRPTWRRPAAPPPPARQPAR